MSQSKDIDSYFKDIEDTDTSATTSQTGTKKPTPTSSNDAEDDDPPELADIKNMVNAPRQSTSSRPDTPKLQAAASSASNSTRARSPAGRRDNINTPTTGSGRSSEEKGAAGTEQKVVAAPPAPASQTQQTKQSPPGGWGGGIWGGLSSFANAAVKYGEAAVKEVQNNEEAQKWAEQMKGNYGTLRGFGDELRARALPTFTNLIHTLAPPISQHERLQIHITHDFVNYPSLDPLIYHVFSRVMSQVEGGDLLVIQRGSESSQKRSMSDAGYTGGTVTGGWNDGAWWSQNDVERNLGIVKGLVEGTKLVRASAEAYGNEFFASRGGVEEAAKQATVVLNESNPVRSSDIFLAIQAIGHTAPSEYFAGSTTATAEKQEAEKPVVEDEKQEDFVSFAIYLHDPIHSIQFSTISQSFPQQWADWIDAKSTTSTHDGTRFVPQLPEEILEIIQNGGVDPREWIAEWIEESLTLAVGIVAQRYVARRMGVGEGGIGRGKRKEDAIESGAGEAARAM